MAWLKSRFKLISFKLFVCFFLVWFPFSCIIAGGLILASMRLTENTIADTQDKISYFSAIINADLNRVKDLLYTMCADPEIAQFAQQRDKTFEYGDYMAYLNAYTKLKDYRQTSMYIDDIFLILPNTDEMLSVNRSVDDISEEVLNMIKEYKESGKAFFIQGDSLTYLYESSSNIMMGIQISVKHIKDTLEYYEGTYYYNFFLIDSESHQLLGGDSVGAVEMDVYRAISDRKKIPKEIRVGGTDYIMGQIQTQGNNFDLIIFTDKKILYKDVNFIRNLWLILNIVAVCVPVLMAVIISKTIQKPMNKLVKAMKKVEGEVYNYRLPVDGSSEFAYVFDQYNCMAMKVEKLIQEVYEKQLQIQQAKLKQLQSQINPHFLFNSLYMGYRMAKSGDTEKTAQLCVYLGDYFRSLTYISDDYVPLSQDIKYIDTYLRLNQMRFPDKLLYEINVDPGLESVVIPHLLIQPLVENSIRHGIEQVKSSCKISIHLIDSDAALKIVVEDDCNVITEEQIELLKEILKQEECPKESVGLWNVQQRIKTMQEAQEGLQMEKTAEGIFRVLFTMQKKYMS